MPAVLPARMLLFLLFFTAPALMAQSQRSADERVLNQQPLQTELLLPLDVSRLHPGSPVMAKVLYNWPGPACMLSSGSTVTGSVTNAHIDASAKSASISLRFDKADCDGKLGSPLRMRVFALIFAPQVSYERAFADQGGLFGSYSATPPRGMGGSVDMSQVHKADLLNDVTVPGHQNTVALPRVIQPGSVFGAKKITLESDGPDGTSVVRAQDKALRLEPGTKLVLMPMHPPAPAPPLQVAHEKNTPPASAPASVLHSSALELATVPALPKDETDVCSTACSAEPAMAHSSLATQAADVISFANLGYSRPDRRELMSFHHAYTVTYLDSTHLLFTFDLHTMRRRQTAGVHPEYVHTVRAVVIDPITRAVLRVVDWQILGEDQYLWPASAGHVLVHLGHQLRLLNASLATEKSYDLPAPLAWVATAPDGVTYAAGLLEERHIAEVHRQMEELTGIEPEESIEVAFLDRDLKVIGSSMQPSTVAPPVLSAHGELRVLPGDRHRWMLEEFGWNHDRRRIAETVSDCQPRVSLPTPDTVFVAGCQNGQNWYRALRLDGHTVLRGTPSSQQLEQAAEGDADNGAFAVRVVWSTISHNATMRIRAMDLRGEQVGVYRANDGARLLLSEVQDVPLAEQSFALAPNAKQLAVMGTRGIYFYGIPSLPAASH